MGSWRLGALTALLVLVGCEDKSPVTVALLAPLTGYSTELGNAGRNGVVLAVEQINANGGIRGRPIELRIYDVGWSPDSNERLIRTLLDSGVQYLLGPYTSNMAAGTLAAMQGRNALLLTPTMSTDALANHDDNILCIQPYNSTQSRCVAEYLRKKGWERISVVFDASNKAYSQTSADSLAKYFLQNGGKEVQMDSLMPDEGGAAQAALRLVARKVQAGVVISTGAQTAMFAQTVYLKRKMPLAGASWGMTRELLYQGGRAVEGMAFCAPTPPVGKHPGGKEFEAVFRERFGQETSFAAVESWEAMQALALGLRLANPDKPLEVRDSLLVQKRLEGVYDSFHWDEHGDVMRPVVQVEVRDGVFQLMENP